MFMSKHDHEVGKVDGVRSGGGSHRAHQAHHAHQTHEAGKNEGTKENKAVKEEEKPAKIDEKDKVSNSDELSEDKKVKDPEKTEDPNKANEEKDSDQDKEIEDLKKEIEELKKQLEEKGKTEEAGEEEPAAEEGGGGGGGGEAAPAQQAQQAGQPGAAQQNWDQKIQEDCNKVQQEQQAAAMGGANGTMAQQGAQMGGYNNPGVTATSAIGAPGGMVLPTGIQPTAQSIGQGGAGQGSAAVNQLVTDYKQAKQSGAQLQDQTKQLVQTTLQGAGLNPGQVLGEQNQQGQQQAGMVNPLGQMNQQQMI